jgi:hypothetical protein
MPAPDFQPGDVIRLPDGKTRRFLGSYNAGPGEPCAVWESIVPRQVNRHLESYIEDYPAEFEANKYTFHCNLSSLKAWARHGVIVVPPSIDMAPADQEKAVLAIGKLALATGRIAEARKAIADFDAEWGVMATEEPEMVTVWDLINNIDSILEGA